MNEIIKFLGSTGCDYDNILVQLDKYHSLKNEYNNLRQEIAVMELDLEIKQYNLIQSEEYKDLKITEKKDKAKRETSTDTLEIIHKNKEKDDVKSKIDLLQYWLRFALQEMIHDVVDSETQIISQS